jgi:cbb3-type cytochrome c oxidase subunit III
MAKHEIDVVTGTATTGHEWDGVKELNTPLPRWWLWVFYATIIWSVLYWIVYPSWPLVSSYTKGVFNYSSRADVAKEIAALHNLRGAKAVALANASLADIEKDPGLLAFARAQGKAAFGDNCAPCHGVGATGAKGYPNLNDDDWLWGGTLPAIYQTIEYMASAPATRRGARTRCRLSARTARSSATRSCRWPITCARCRGSPCARASISPPARRSMPTTAPFAMATRARATKS